MSNSNSTTTTNNDTDIFSYAAEADAERTRAARAEARIMILASENLSISSKLSTAMTRVSTAETFIESMHETATSRAVEHSARIFSLLAENESLSNHLASLRGTLERIEGEKIEMQGAIHSRNQSLASTCSRADANDIEREELRALTGDLAEELDTMRLRIATLETSLARSREREASLMATLSEADAALLQARTVGIEAMLASDVARSAERAAVREAREVKAAIAIERAEIASSTLIANAAAATASSHTADMASRAALDLILTSNSSSSSSSSSNGVGSGNGGIMAVTSAVTTTPAKKQGESQNLLSSRLEESRATNLTIKLELESVRGAHASVLRRAELAEEEIFHFKREAALATACAEENKAKALRAITALAAADSRTEDVNRALMTATQRADTLLLSIDVARRAVSTAEAERDAAMFAATKQATAREAALYRAAAAESAASSALEEAREARRTASRTARASAITTVVESDADNNNMQHSQYQALSTSLLSIATNSSPPTITTKGARNENALSPASGLRQDLARLHAVLTSTQASLNASSSAS